MVFPSFVMGVPITNTYQWNNTLYLSESVTKVLGAHTMKFGGQFHNDQVNENPNATFNGTFSFLGTETGNPLSRIFCWACPATYTQTTGQRFYLRNRYDGAFVQDSWRARSNLTVNLGSALGYDHALEREVQQHPDHGSGRAVGSLSQRAAGPGGSRRSGNSRQALADSAITISLRESAWRIRRISTTGS